LLAIEHVSPPFAVGRHSPTIVCLLQIELPNWVSFYLLKVGSTASTKLHNFSHQWNDITHIQ